MMKVIYRAFISSFVILLGTLIALPSHAENCQEDYAGVPGIAGTRAKNRPQHVYAGHTSDWADWINGNGAWHELTRIRTHFYAVNGSSRPTKARLSAFNSSGALVFEADRCILPGRTTALMQADLLQIGMVNAEMFVISSDEPILIDAYASVWSRNLFSIIEPGEGVGLQEAQTHGKRTIDFPKVKCPKSGFEFFCKAATVVTQWKVDAGDAPTAAPWPP